jgi:hypothetical protein
LLLQRYFHSQVSDITVFNSHYSYFDEADIKIDALRATLMKNLPAWMTYSRNERAMRRREFAEGKAPKEVSHFVDRFCRFMIAAVGGMFLVGFINDEELGDGLSLRPDLHWRVDVWSQGRECGSACFHRNVCCCSGRVCGFEYRKW